ncbi:MAG: MarR family winged helix-turn-helix transcriptional regulator [Lachnospiraceae bacterium]|nr:MarR family winged helix-turn-helix transcriptional regulator [Lachnospiraceae bacterium]
MDTRETINDILVNLIRDIWDLEEQAIITEEFQDISNNDMHIIEAIGMGVDSTMSMVAKKLGITAGSLTTSVNGLVNKKYVLRERGEVDRRVVYICLTDKGQKAYRHHAHYHQKLTEAVVASLEPAEIPVLLKALNHLSDFFRNYKEDGSETIF